MKKMTLIAFSLTAIIFLMSMPATAQQQKDKTRDDDDFSYHGWQDNPGVWSAIIHDDKAHIQFGGLHWSSSSTFGVSELGTLPTGQTGTFTVKRDPGTVTFNGKFAEGAGHGTYVFTENPAFKSYLEQEGFKDVPEELMIHLFFTNINKDYFAYMKGSGYQGITMDQLKDLAYQNMNQRVMTAYLELFKKEGYGKVSLGQIVELREHGVTPDFINGLHEMGYAHVSLDKALEARDHGVTADFVAEMKKAGARDISLDEAIELRDHGVTVEFIREIQRMGFKDISPDKAQELQDHGVTAAFIQRMQEKGLKNLSLDEYVRLRDAGM